MKNKQLDEYNYYLKENAFLSSPAQLSVHTRRFAYYRRKHYHAGTQLTIKFQNAFNRVGLARMYVTTSKQLLEFHEFLNDYSLQQVKTNKFYGFHVISLCKTRLL